MERAGRLMPTMEGLAAFFEISRATLRSTLYHRCKDKLKCRLHEYYVEQGTKLREALARGKEKRTGAFLRRQQQLADGYWFCAAPVDEKGKVLCRFPLEAREDECPQHPGEPDNKTVFRAFCSPHVIASIWVGKNQHGQTDRSPLEERDAKKIPDAELAEGTREALEFMAEELPDGENDGTDEDREGDEDGDAEPRRTPRRRNEDDEDEDG